MQGTTARFRLPVPGKEADLMRRSGTRKRVVIFVAILDFSGPLVAEDRGELEGD